MTAAFDPARVLPDEVMARITDVRVGDPDRARRAAQARKRRSQLAPTGRLNVLAADHPARGVTRGGADPMGLADRRSLLARCIRVLQSEYVDGIMATMDVIEDLLILDDLVREAKGRPLLDEQLVIASLNRGGLAGAGWELDDPITGPAAASYVDHGIDGGKLLLRVNETDAGSLRTVEAAARAVTEHAERGLPIFLEPLPVVREGDRWVVKKDADAIARLVGVAAGLGESSRFTWLKLPHCDRFEVVARASTLPILLLGGESQGGPEPLLQKIAAALDAGPSVRGALVGRNVLFPGDDDPMVAAASVGTLVHSRVSVEDAMEYGARHRDEHLDALADLLGA